MLKSLTLNVAGARICDDVKEKNLELLLDNIRSVHSVIVANKVHGLERLITDIHSTLNFDHV